MMQLYSYFRSSAAYRVRIALNLKGPFRLSALVAERIVAAGGGSIINVSSTAAVTPSPSAKP